MITVIAGVNGAGKSSVAGASIRLAGGEYFNPDEVARQLKSEDTSLSLYDANSKAWKIGYDQLVYAIKQNIDYIYETTLGGNSITRRLLEAIESGVQVRIFYVGLSSPELHIERFDIAVVDQDFIRKIRNLAETLKIHDRQLMCFVNIDFFIGFAGRFHAHTENGLILAGKVNTVNQ